MKRLLICFAAMAFLAVDQTQWPRNPVPKLDPTNPFSPKPATNPEVPTTEHLVLHRFPRATPG